MTKRLNFRFLTFGLISMLAAFAVQASEVNAGKNLYCQMYDVSRHRLLDQNQATIKSDSILFLMGTSELVGHVRDTQGATINDRHLDLTLSYQIGSVWGETHGATDYKLTDKVGQLIAVTLEDPSWGHLLSLSCELRQEQNMTLMAPHTTYESGYGSSSGYCDSRNSYFCYDNLKRDAQDRAVRDAEISCQIKRGRLDSFSKSCFDNCNPYSLPPDNENRQTYVTCDSRCTVRCEVAE